MITLSTTPQIVDSRAAPFAAKKSIYTENLTLKDIGCQSRRYIRSKENVAMLR